MELGLCTPKLPKKLLSSVHQDVHSSVLSGKQRHERAMSQTAKVLGRKGKPGGLRVANPPEERSLVSRAHSFDRTASCQGGFGIGKYRSERYKP